MSRAVKLNYKEHGGIDLNSFEAAFGPGTSYV